MRAWPGGHSGPFLFVIFEMYAELECAAFRVPVRVDYVVHPFKKGEREYGGAPIDPDERKHVEIIGLRALVDNEEKDISFLLKFAIDIECLEEVILSND